MATKPSQLDYDAAVREPDHFVSPLRFLAEHTSHLEDAFADFCYRTRASRLVKQRHT